MAQHLDIGKAGFDLLFKDLDVDKFRDNSCFKRVNFMGGKIYLCDRSYNEGSGLRGDEFVLTYVPKDEECVYEIHFNYRNKVNKVYLVN